MSAILVQTQEIYKKSLLIEFMSINVCFLCLLFYGLNSALSFFLGAVSTFIPQITLIFWVYFRRQKGQKVIALYQGESIKFAMTVLFTLSVFGLYQTISFLLFFVGFIVGLVLNNLLPLYFQLKLKST